MPRRIDNNRREAGGRFWGAYTTTALLPGTAAGLALDDLTYGDIAAVGGELYVCISTVPLNAVWKKASRDDGTLTASTLTVTSALQVDDVATFDGDVTMSATLSVEGGILGTTPARVSNIPVGAVAYGSLGTNTTPTSGTMYVSEIYLPLSKTITGIAVLNGGTVGTDETIYFLADATGVILATTALAGVTTAGQDTFQEIELIDPYFAAGPATYLFGVQYNGNTTRVRTIAANTYLNLTISQVGVFATIAAIDPVPTATVADVGPIGYLYT